MIDLPNELWCLIVKKMNYIDVFNLSVTSKRFHQICLQNKSYKKRLRLSKQRVSYGADNLNEFVLDTLKYLSRDIDKSFRHIIVESKHVFSTVEIKMKRIAPEFSLLKF